MANNYDVYMCRLEQLEGDLMSLIGKPIHTIRSQKYKDVLSKIPNNWKVSIHRDGNELTGIITDVVVNR